MGRLQGQEPTAEVWGRAGPGRGPSCEPDLPLPVHLVLISGICEPGQVGPAADTEAPRSPTQQKVPGRSAEPHLLPGAQRPRHRHLTPSERAGGIEELSHTRGHCRRSPQSHRLRPPAARGQTKGTTGRSCRVSTLSCADAQLGALRLTSLSSSARLETRHSGGPLIYTWAH